MIYRLPALSVNSLFSLIRGVFTEEIIIEHTSLIETVKLSV